MSGAGSPGGVSPASVDWSVRPLARHGRGARGLFHGLPHRRPSISSSPPFNKLVLGLLLDLDLGRPGAPSSALPWGAARSVRPLPTCHGGEGKGGFGLLASPVRGPELGADGDSSMPDFSLCAAASPSFSSVARFRHHTPLLRPPPPARGRCSEFNGGPVCFLGIDGESAAVFCGLRFKSWEVWFSSTSSAAGERIVHEAIKI
jgi:hypothetical protein